MALITTISQLKQYVTGIVVNAQNSASLPNMDIADEKYIVPVIGQDLYNKVTSATHSTDEDNVRLTELCRRAVAPLSVLDMLARKQLQISDNGVHSIIGENQAAPARWQYLKLEESLQNDGAYSLEALWNFLFTHATKLSWKNPLPQKTLFKGGIDFSKYYPLSEPHRLYFLLLPLIQESEDEFIIGSVGEDFYTGIRDEAKPDDNTKKLTTLWKKAIANYTIYKACTKLASKVTDRGFTVLMGDSGEQPWKGQQDSSYQLKQALMLSTQNDGGHYITQANNFLNAIASNIIFADYFNSSYYTAPQNNVPFDYLKDNKNRKNFNL